MRVDDRVRGTHAAATTAVRRISGVRQHPDSIANNVKALGYPFSRLAGSRDAHKAMARTSVRLRVDPSMARAK
jgi:hypothetical protein